MSIVWFIVIIVALILVHELGHFLAAKATGTRVDEFGLGFPPKIAGWKYGETEYTLNWIPFGGFVKIFGENPDEESIEGSDRGRSFVHKPKWAQAVILVAGVFFNMVFAWLLISLGFVAGMPTPADYASAGTVRDPQLTITRVAPESPAAAAGLQTGDTVTALESDGDILSTLTPERVSSFIDDHQDADITVGYTRGDTEETVSVTPAAGIVEEGKAIGISMDMIGMLELGPFASMWEGLKTTTHLTGVVTVGLAEFFYNAFTGQANFGEVAGPVGIVGLVGDASQLGLIYLLNFTAIISIHLAIINLIPFPALDGGRLLFVAIEKIKGSPIRPQVANAVNGVGFVLLILLMIVVTYHDIIKLL